MLAFRWLCYCPTLSVLPCLALHWSLGCHRSWPAFPSRSLAFHPLRHCRTLPVLPCLALHWSLGCHRSLPVVSVPDVGVSLAVLPVRRCRCFPTCVTLDVGLSPLVTGVSVRMLAFRWLCYCPTLPVLPYLALHWSFGCRRSLPVCPFRMLAFRWLYHYPTWLCFPTWRCTGRWVVTARYRCVRSGRWLFRWLYHYPTWLVLPRLALHWTLACRRSSPAYPFRMLAFRPLSH